MDGWTHKMIRLGLGPMVDLVNILNHSASENSTTSSPILLLEATTINPIIR
jgi:hypothetical protein